MIEQHATLPPRPAHASRPKTQAWDAIFTALSHDSWTSVPLTDVTGKNPNRKQTNAHSRASVRGLKVVTRTIDDRLYIRLREDKPDA